MYPAPLNLVEIVIAPLEYVFRSLKEVFQLTQYACHRYVLPHHAWDRLNLTMMGTLLFIPLTVIAFFESTLNTTAHQRLRQYFSDDVLEDEDDPELQDPEEAEEGTICKEKFADLVKVFPKCVAILRTYSGQTTTDMTFLVLDCPHRPRFRKKLKSCRNK